MTRIGVGGASLALALSLAGTPAHGSRDEFAVAGPLTRLNDLDRRTTDLLRRRQELAQIKEDLEFEMDRAEERRSTSQAAGERVRRTRLRRLAVLHRQGGVLRAGLALGARTRDDLRRRRMALATVLIHDRRLAEHHLNAAGSLASAKDQGAAVRRRLNALGDSLKALERSLTQGVQRRRALIDAMGSDPRTARRAAHELGAGRRSLSAHVGRQEAAPPADASIPHLPFALGKGQLEMPVRGKVVRGYGERRKGRWGPPLRNEGYDIGAVAGSEVRAVWSGEVSFADWLPGFGLVVVVNHGQGWHTVYGHLRAAAAVQGVRVATGDPVGIVGATGTWDAPHLHFEVRRGAASVDPGDWLAQR